MLVLVPLSWEGREKKRPEQRGREPPLQGCLVRKDFGFDFMQSVGGGGGENQCRTLPIGAA